MIKLDLNIGLNDILKCVNNNYIWIVLEIQGFGLSNIMPFEKKVNSSKYGYIILLEELLNLENKYSQIINFLLVGNRCNVDSYDNINDFIRQSEIVIELVDSSYWEISCKNRKEESFIKKEFQASVM